MTTITIGLDGANWKMIRPWLDGGDLPNLRRLVDAGVGGVSKACLPPLTVPNWKCYATGKQPGRFDVFRFDRVDTDAGEYVFHDATDFKSAELWDYLNDAGYTAGVVNKPSTYPPREIDGFLVAGGPDASETSYRSLSGGFATPESVERELREELEYQVHPTPMISPTEKGDAEIEAVLELIDMRFAAAEHLLDSRDPDFLHLTVFYSMALQHYFWTDDPVYRAWRHIDENLSRFTDQGHDILVMSDHGTREVETVFYVNAFLADRGYLTPERSLDAVLGRLGLTRERALALAKRLNATETLSRVVPERIQRLVPWDEGIKRERLLAAVDWDRTKAIASTQGPVYLNANGAAYDRLREELLAELTDLEHPRTGERLVRAVHRGEEYYEGPFAENAPDLLLDLAPGVHASDALGPDRWVADAGVWRGGNDPEGLFVFSGPSFRSEGLKREANIVDLAPTVLHAMDVAVPTDIDGEVLDVFADGTSTADRPVRYRDPIPYDRRDEAATGEDGDVQSRLEDLGYLEG
jgi:predicted AlkP superfamily phosphohydrolase/phosphomutase